MENGNEGNIEEMEKVGESGLTGILETVRYLESKTCSLFIRYIQT